MKEEIKNLLPKNVTLFYVDYRDDLSENLDVLEECVRENSYDMLNEKVWDWYDDASDSEDYYIEDIQSRLDFKLKDDDIDDIRDYLRDNDSSNIVEELLSNTGDISCFYSLGMEVDGWSESAFLRPSIFMGSPKMDAYKIRRMLGIKKGTNESDLIDSVLQNASYGGEVRLYFDIPFKNLISKYGEDFTSIHFKGRVCLAVYHSSGSGDFEFIDIDKKFQFKRDNLFLSISDRYPIQDCFGMCSDWLRDTCYPIFGNDNVKKSLDKSKQGDIVSMESKYKKTFAQGKCTLGDTNYSRHRDVYYKNEIPCGSICPHCGQFWVD